MDTSETYIKMTHLAFPSPDVVPIGKSQKVEPHIYVDGIGQWWADWQGWFVPLYRQDQLQEMIELTGYHFTFYESFSSTEPKQLEWFGERHIGQWFVRGWSMEQLWLAFVMKEKYDKTWDGEDWI